MKILLLSNKVPYPANDGSSIAIQSMIDGYLANGADVSLLSINTNKHYKSQVEIFGSKPGDLQMHWQDANTNVSAVSAFLNLFSSNAYHVSRFLLSSFAEKLKELISSSDFDVIQLEGLAMAVYVPQLRKISQAKIVLRAHNAEYQIWERTAKKESNPLLKLYLGIQVKRLKRFEAQISNQIDALVTITEEDQKLFQNLGFRGRSISIPCGISLEKYRVKSEVETDFDISYLASFDWKPNLQGLDWFINEVWPEAIKLKPELTMALGGRKIPDRIKSLKLKGLTIVGEVESMPVFIQNSKINVVPLLAGSGMRIKIVENMALSRPMVSTSIGAEGIEINEGKEIILEDNPKAFAKAMVKLVEDENLRNEMGRAARRKIENSYDNKFLGKKLIEFYRTEI